MQIPFMSYTFMHDVLNHVARIAVKYILTKVINFSKKRAVAVRKFSPERKLCQFNAPQYEKRKANEELKGRPTGLSKIT